MTIRPEDMHGERNTYRRGCRCTACRGAQRVYQLRMNRQRATRLLADPSVVRHGLKSTYDNWHCRCEPCTSAMSADREGRR